MIESFLKIIQALEKFKISYCVIGGVAILIYGGRASTLDLDFYFVAEDEHLLLKTLGSLGAKVTKRGEFQFQGVYQGFRFDVLVADQWIGMPALKRAESINFLETKIRIATPEDLIVMKTLADRPIDRRDIQELRELFVSLDEKYIKKQLLAARKALASE